MKDKQGGGKVVKAGQKKQQQRGGGGVGPLNNAKVTTMKGRKGMMPPPKKGPKLPKDLMDEEKEPIITGVVPMELVCYEEEVMSPKKNKKQQQQKANAAVKPVKNGVAKKKPKQEEDDDDQEEEDDDDDFDEDEEDSDDEFGEEDEEDDEELGSGMEEDENDDEELEGEDDDDEEDEEIEGAEDEETELKADDDDDDDEEEEDDEEDEDDDDEDEAPMAEPIEKAAKVKHCPIPNDFPIANCIHVRWITPLANKVDVMETFSQFGPMEYVYLTESQKPQPYLVADIGYKNEKSAKEALLYDEPLLVKDIAVSLYTKRPQSGDKKSDDIKDLERTVRVRQLGMETNEVKLRAHFEEFGTIEKLSLIRKHKFAFAYILYKDKEMANKALKMHNTILGGKTISVKISQPETLQNQRDPKLTVILRNVEGLEMAEGSVLKSIFEKCGEITSMDVICGKGVLAFISFKTEAAVAKAHKLNGKTEEGMKLEICAYEPEKSKTAIFVTNLSKDVTVEDLQELFSKSGEVTSVILKKGFAIVYFKDSEGYCKSFLLNETVVKNQMIFLEPHSVRKQALYNERKGSKRPLIIQNDLKQPFRPGGGGGGARGPHGRFPRKQPRPASSNDGGEPMKRQKKN